MPKKKEHRPHADYLWVSRGLPRDLALILRDAMNIGTFIETGTYHGGTTRWAGENFKGVVTIEAAPALHATASAAGKHQGNVQYLLGDSGQLLPGVVAGLKSPALFWLDGHFSGDDTAGTGYECPLVAELKAVAASPLAHAIFIDDARLLLSTPKSGHKREQWPTLIEMIDALRACAGNPHIVVIADIIIAVPDTHRRILEDWCVGLNDESWGVYKRKYKKKPKGFVSRLIGR